jgi:predicted nucleic acid-binding protein
VFIGWIKGETVDGIPRAEIAAAILELGEQRVIPIFISPLTLAEVQQKKGQPRVSGDENENVPSYFEHPFVTVVPIDREVGEEANRLCRLHEAERLSPADAIHLACAKRAGCDVLLTWDGPLLTIAGEGIRIERPTIWTPSPPPSQGVQESLLDRIEALASGSPQGDSDKGEADIAATAELPGSDSRSVESEAAEEEEGSEGAS